MNIMFFLTPKSSLTVLYDDMNFGEGMEILTASTYTAMPLLTREGRYLGALSEGDFLRAIQAQKSIVQLAGLSLRRLERGLTSRPLRADAQLRDVVEVVLNQNFVPVIDDREYFVGIITRKRVLDYCLSHLEEFGYHI